MDPIAVDVPAKLPATPGPKPAPAPKPEPKREPEPEAAAPAAPAAPAVPVKLAKVGLGLTRRRVVVTASAVCSLIAGVSAVKLMSGKSESPEPPASVQLLTREVTAAPP